MKDWQADQNTSMPAIRNSRKTGGGKNDDIMKELEDYVNEKKQTNKYLDDISDLDNISNNANAVAAQA